MIHEQKEVYIEGTTWKVSEHKFDSLSELSKHIKNTKINKIWNGHELSSKQNKGRGFNDFNNYEDAINALDYGTEMYYNQFKKNIKKVKDFISKNQKNCKSNYKNDQVGFLPIVPKVIQGNPINMINQDIKAKPYPTAKIILSKTVSSNIDVDDINEFYSIIFVLIQMLEMKGIRCEIWINISAKQYSEVMTYNINLKKYTQPLNIYKMQFPVISSDFFRRICFRLFETNPDIKEGMWVCGYGSILFDRVPFNTAKKITGINEDDIFIPSCEHFEYHNGDDLDQSIKRIINETNFKNYIKLD